MEPGKSLLELAMQNRARLHRVFISYHHSNDQVYKESLLELNKQHSLFIDASVDTGDVSDGLPDETIRTLIRDDYLRNSTVTILLVGSESKKRKHIDWEIYSSMYDGLKNKKSGVLVINLPAAGSISHTVGHDGEKEAIYPNTTNWINIKNRADYERRYPMMPARIIDNLLQKDAKISVTDWDTIFNDPSKLRRLINYAHDDRTKCVYDLSQAMRRSNS